MKGGEKMSCEEIKKLLDEYITGELEGSASEKVREHLEKCPDCEREYEELKSLKAELYSLSENLPRSFDEGLKAKIRKEKRADFWNVKHFGAGMAAAVVLVCLIGLGYGAGHRGIFEDKMNGVRSSGAAREEEAVPDNSEREENAAEVFSEYTTIYIEDNEAEIILQGSAEEAEEALTEGNEKAAEAASEREDGAVSMAPETAEGITEADFEARNNVNNTDAAAEIPVESTSEAAANKTHAAFKSNAAQEQKQSAETKEAAVPSEDTVGESESADLGFKKASSFAANDDCALTAAPAAEYEEEAAEALSVEATLTVKRERLAEVKEALEKIEGVSEVEYTEGKIYAQVYGLPYGELKEKLSAYNAEEKNAAPEAVCSAYELVIEAE